MVLDRPSRTLEYLLQCETCGIDYRLAYIWGSISYYADSVFHWLRVYCVASHVHL